MARKKIVAGNWKMNTDYDEAKSLSAKIANGFFYSDVVGVLAPPFISLMNVKNNIRDVRGLFLAAQNAHYEDSGAFTGEISAPMIKSVGAHYVIIGHSERRGYFKESNDTLAMKVDAALRNELLPIFCCGEPLEIREKGKHEAFVKVQLEESLFHLSEDDFSKVVIAYEPIWAIGTGVTASPEQAQDMHRAIRKMVEKHYGVDIADDLSILYGGSVKPSNAKEIFAQPDVDGGLIGGAALDADSFLAIVAAFA